MSKRASPEIIGAFVIVALALIVAAILIVGGGHYFHRTGEVVVYFDGSISGLQIGAPVKFRGIELGKVKDMRINMTNAMVDPQNIRIPVLLEMDEDNLVKEGVPRVDFDDRAQVARIVESGLRAELATESLVTGVRYVALDIKPGTPARLMNDERYPEIPSLRGTWELLPEKVNQLLAKLAELDLGALAVSLHSALDHADRLLASPQLMQAVESLDDLVAVLQKSAGDVSHVARDLHPAITELERAATSAREALEPAGRLSAQVDTTLREVQVAARSLHRLTDQLGRDPGAIVRGGRP